VLTKENPMSFLTRKNGWLAAIALCAALFSAHRVAAQTVEERAESAATAAAHEAEEAEHGAPKGDPNPLAFRTDLALWTLFVFLILFGFLSYFAWPQIAAALDERERKIADSIAAAEARLAEAQKVLVEHEKKLAAAAGEVRELLEEARRDADHTRKSIEAKGHQAAQDELARAIREIDRAKDAAVQDLAVRSANVAIDLARKVVREQLTPEHQNEVVREALSKFTGATPSKN
jgi:F-type H+-transporting ATPase subunit b